MSGDFRNWVARLFQSKTAARAADRRTPRRAPVFRIESLEDRVVPAITVLDAATGGTLDADLIADGVVNGNGTLSRGALASIPAATNISVTAASGDLTFNNFAATVTLLTGGGSSATFVAPGAITFADPTDNFATSGGGLIFTAGGTATLASLSGGSLAAQAGGALAVTSATTTGGIDLTSTTANVSSTGTLQTPGQLTLGAATGIAVQTSAATLQASNGSAGDITVTQTAAPSQLLTITNTAGGVVNNAPGGKITITNLGSGIQLGASAPVQSSNGAITLAAQDLIIDPTATVAAGTGVTTLANSDAGRPINLGGNGVTVGKLTLTQGELDRVTGTGALRIGSSTSGDFEVNAPITRTTSPLTLVSGALMHDEGTGGITATNLRLSGVGPILLNSNTNNVTNLVADLGGSPSGSLVFVNGTNALTVGAGIDGVTGVTTTNGDVRLVADLINIPNPINVGNGPTGGVVVLQNFTTGRDVTLGGVVVGTLSLLNAELNRVTARVLQVGDTNTGAITITGAVTLGANVPTLRLVSRFTDTVFPLDPAISQTAPLTVTNLVTDTVARVALTDNANDVDFVAATTSVNPSAFELHDADGLTVGLVEGVSGITTNGSTALIAGGSISLARGISAVGYAVSLVAGGNVTQALTPNAAIFTGLELLVDAGGFVDLTNPNNDVTGFVTGNSVGGFSYTDANDFGVWTETGTTTPAGTAIPPTTGITTLNAPITLRAVNGDVAVGPNPFTATLDAGTAAVTLSAEGAGNSILVQNKNNGKTHAILAGSATLTADQITLDANGGTNVGGGTVVLQPFTAGRPINLGGADTAADLGISDAELDTITAGIIRVGNATAGNITVTGGNVSPGGTSQLELVTGAGVLDGDAGLTDITVTRLGITAVSGIGVGGADIRLDINVSNVEATTDTGGIQLANQNGAAVTIGGVNATLTGLDVTTSGSLVFTNGDTITIGATATEGITVVGGGNIDVSNTSNNIIVNAPVAATGGNGNVTINAEDNVNLNAAVSATGGGDITIIAEPSIGGAGTLTSTAAGTVTAETGDIRLAAMDNVTLAGAVAVTAGTGTITVIAEAVTGPSAAAGNFSNSGTGTLTTAGGDIYVQAGDDVTVGAAIAAGGAGKVTLLADAAIDSIGNVTSSAPASTVSGSISAQGVNVTLNTGGTVTSTAGGAITLRATSGSGGDATIGAAVTTSGGNGNILIEADDDVIVNAAVSAAGAGTITLTGNVGPSGNGDVVTNVGGTLASASGNITATGVGVAINATITSTAGGSVFLTATGGDVDVNAGGAVTLTGGNGFVNAVATGNIDVAAAVSVVGNGYIVMQADGDGVGGGVYTSTAAGDLSTQGGNIIILGADVIALGDFDTNNTTTSRVSFFPSTTGAVIYLGGTAAFGLDDSEVDLVTAGVLQLGDATNAGGIALAGTVTVDPTLVPVMSLVTGGAVVDGTAADAQDDLFVASLAIQSGTGVGSADTINIAVTNLAVNNTTSGNVFVSNHLFSAGGPLTITVVDGVTGVRNDGPGDIFVGNTGGLFSIVEDATATGGGNVTLTNAGAGADVVVGGNAHVVASGGDGNIIIDSTGATSGGAIIINATSGLEVVAAGFGNITISARDAVTLASAVQVQAGNTAAGGDIGVSANVGVPGGGADITLNGTSSVQTRGNVSLTTDPDFVLTGTAGADIVMSPQSIIKGNGVLVTNNLSLSITLRADGDVVVSNVWADTDLGITAAENIVDDGDTAGETFIQATDIQLIAGGIIGGAVQITPLDIFSGNTGTPTAPYRGAIDFDLDNGGSLIVTTGAAVVLTGTGGNVQLRQVDDPLDVNPEPVRTQDLNFTNASINSDNQLAVISSAGDFLVDTGFVVPSNADVLLATTAGFSVLITGGVTNPGGATADTTIVVSGSPTAGITGTPGGVADVVGPNVNLVTTGGSIGTSAALPLEINATRLDGQTTGAAAPGGSAFITDTQNGVAVGRFDAGGGDVVLTSLGNNGTTANITAISPNDNTAEIIANTVTLDTTAAGPVAGPNGQIGLPGTFFEVNANVINAATNNSSLWISEVGTGGSAGATVGSVTAGTATAFLRVRNGGTLTSDDPGVPDVVAATVNLSTVAGDTPAGGNFGASLASPLEINATTLNSNLAGGGNLFVVDTAGGLTVQRANTTAGNVGIQTATGGSLVLGNGSSSGSVVLATGGTATLVSAGSITSAAPAGVKDVTAVSLAATAATGIGVGVAPAGAIETAVSNLAFSNAAGAVNIANTGALTIAAVGSLATSANLGTTTTVSAASPMTFAVNTVSVGSATYTAGETADAPTFADDLTINSGVTVSVTAGALTLQAGDEIVLNTGSIASASGAVTLNVGFNDLDGIGGAVIRGTVAGSAAAAVNGGTGADTVLVDFTGGATLPNGLTFAGGGAADKLQVSDAGGAATHAYVISAAGAVRDGGPALAFAADVESVDVTGGNLADSFTVTATAATAINVHGGPPTTGAGDSLVVTNASTAFLSTTGTGSVSGTYDFPAGTADVTFDSIESLNVGTDAVSVTKTDSITNAIPGTTVTYTVVVTNNATVGLSGIRVQDVVPAALTGVQFTAVFAGTGSTGNIGPVAGNNIDQTISLAAGGTATYTISGTLAPTTPAGTNSLSNTVTVTPPAGVTDNPANNSATDTDNVVPTGDVTVTKTNGTTITAPGTTTTYTIVVSNAGPSTVSLTLADVFPAAIVGATRTVVNGGGATGGTAGNGNINDTLTIPGGGTVTYTVSAPVSGTATGTLVNTATATILTPGFDQGANAGPDSATDTDTLTPQGDVAVTKTNGTTTVTAGTTTTYTITVTNTGPSTVTVPFADNLPAQIISATRTVVNGGGATGGTPGSGNIADTLTLPANSTVTYTVTATINPAAPAGTLTNTATATVPGSFDQGGNTTNDSATDADTLVAAPDLAVTAAAPTTGKVGTPFTYTFTVSNFGQSTQTNVVLTHALPVESINVTSSSTQGTTVVTGGVLTATIGTLAPGAVATVTVTLNPTDDGAFVLTATAAGAIPEPNTANNTGTAVTQVAPYQPLIVAGPGNGGGAEVRVLNANTGALEARFIPFGPFYSFAMSVTQGDINGDGVPEIIIGSGPGGAARIVAYDVRTGAELRSFFAFEPNVTGGVNVGAGDIDGDGKDDIIAGAGAGFGPRVRVFSGANNAEILSFFAYEASFTGGVRVAAGDVNGDGRLDIITGAGGGGSSRVQVFDGTNLKVLQNFFAFGDGLREGVYVAAADTNGDGIAEIVAGAGGGGASHIRVFDGKTGAEKGSFFAFAPTARDGVTVGKTDRNNDGIDDITAGTGVGVQAQVKVFTGSGFEEAVFNAFDIGFVNGVYVG